jgi:pimeloyl-ACP methyl ester carboxylesterase
MTILVLLPGMDGTGELFAPFLAALGPEVAVRIVRYPTAKALGYAELAAIVEAALPQAEPYVLIAESFAGPIAIALAASHAARLRGLVLCCSFARNPRPAFSALGFLVPALALAPRPLGPIGWLLLGRFATAPLRAALGKALRQVPGAVLTARLRAVLAVDASAAFAAVKVPILYLRAARDRLVPAAASQHLLRLKPEMRLVEFDAPHFLLQAVPAEAVRIVRAFVDEVSPRD